MKTVTRSHICAITIEAANKLCEEAGRKPINLEMMKLDTERVIAVKREAYGTIEGKAFWTRLSVTERTD